MPAVVWTAAVVTDGSAEGYGSRERRGTYCLRCAFTGSVGEVTIKGLKPETKYEVKVSAVNGKGEGESSPAHFFSTEPVSKWHRFHPRQHTPKGSSRPLDFVSIRALPGVALVLESVGGRKKKKTCWSHLLIGGERKRERKKKNICEEKTLHAAGQLHTSQQWCRWDGVTMASKTFHSPSVPADLSRSETDHSHQHGSTPRPPPPSAPRLFKEQLCWRHFKKQRIQIVSAFIFDSASTSHIYQCEGPSKAHQFWSMEFIMCLWISNPNKKKSLSMLSPQHKNIVFFIYKCIYRLREDAWIQNLDFGSLCWFRQKKPPPPSIGFILKKVHFKYQFEFRLVVFFFLCSNYPDAKSLYFSSFTMTFEVELANSSGVNDIQSMEVLRYTWFLNRFMLAHCINKTMTWRFLFFFYSFYYFAFGFNFFWSFCHSNKHNYYIVW